eukprot:TRINITY_DN3192_c0_g1_i1.p2 TRINITY_DN3192_c0_g1~~TRINITY_DN3192_c0_g1_i1.p2  ORF type:complete len:121 (-),score=31.74 TRINITY_DN3192_c0_g1_i1:834-1196(-)
MLESFSLSMDKTFAQYQCGDPITNDTIKDGDTWRERFPNKLIGWIYIYPNSGTLVSLPDKCDLDYCMGYIPYATGNTTFENRSSCFDAVANILVTGEDEEELEGNINNIYQWWEANTQWK